MDLALSQKIIRGRTKIIHEKIIINSVKSLLKIIAFESKSGITSKSTKNSKYCFYFEAVLYIFAGIISSN